MLRSILLTASAILTLALVAVLMPISPASASMARDCVIDDGSYFCETKFETDQLHEEQVESGNVCGDVHIHEGGWHFLCLE